MNKKINIKNLIVVSALFLSIGFSTFSIVKVTSAPVICQKDNQIIQERITKLKTEITKKDTFIKNIIAKANVRINRANTLKVEQKLIDSVKTDITTVQANEAKVTLDIQSLIAGKQKVLNATCDSVERKTARENEKTLWANIISDEKSSHQFRIQAFWLDMKNLRLAIISADKNVPSQTLKSSLNAN